MSTWRPPLSYDRLGGIAWLVRALERSVLQPWFEGRAVRLHPLVTALARAS